MSRTEPNSLAKYDSCFSISRTFVLILVIALKSSTILAEAAVTRAHRQTPNVWADDVFDRLDTGLYWARANDQFERASSTSANGSIYFNVHRPTMIYIHGLQPGTVRMREREDFTRVLVFGAKHLDFARMWRRRGWNVGILYWNQYADQVRRTSTKFNEIAECRTFGTRRRRRGRSGRSTTCSGRTRARRFMISSRIRPSRKFC